MALRIRASSALLVRDIGLAPKNKNVILYCQSMTTFVRLSLLVMTFIARRTNSVC